MRKLLLMIGLTLAAWSANAATSILVLGDSLSAAYGIDEEKGWVQLLRNHLQSRGDYRVINASVSGETSGGALARLPLLLETHKPQFVVVELGANDGLRGYPIKILENNLVRIVGLSREAGAKVLLLGMQIPPNYGARYTQQFKQVYARLAASLSLASVPFFMERVGTEPGLMQRDGLHPNAKAQPVLLDNVLSPLILLLES